MFQPLLVALFTVNLMPEVLFSAQHPSLIEGEAVACVHDVLNCVHRLLSLGVFPIL